VSTFVDPSPAEILGIISESHSVALVGVSDDPVRASNFVARNLVRTLLRIHPVNPRCDEVLGLPCYPSLADLPEVPDIVCCFRRREHLPGVVEEAIAIGAPTIWFQLGLRHDEAALRALAAGMRVVQDRCLKIEHARWAGGLHTAGFDTGVLTSSRKRPL
jgi:predicted CoA-binding protein